MLNRKFNDLWANTPQMSVIIGTNSPGETKMFRGRVLAVSRIMASFTGMKIF